MSDEVQFTPGDVVQLKSGGPKMTIKGIGQYSVTNGAACVWFEGHKPQEKVFELHLLKKAE